MAPPPVMIRVGGSIDATLGRSLRTAVDMVAQAEKNAQKSKRETTKVAETEAARQVKAQERLTRAAESLDRQRAAALFRQYRQQEAAADKAAKAELRSRQRTEDAARREIEKTARAAVRALEAEERAQARVDKRAGESFARRTSHRATRFLSASAPLLPMAGRALTGVAQGLGVDFSVAGATSRVVDLKKQAQQLSNSGYQAGQEGANGKRVDPRELIAQARQVGGVFGTDAAEILGGLQQFQKIAGDLDTGRQNLFQMAQLSKATGTNILDMAAATANVSNGLGDMPNKAQVLDEVMRTIAGQGKLGAVEISDMATQMARIAAAAGNFGGDRAKNIAEFGALAQIARAEGGAPSAAESARSMGGFATTFRKGARNKEFTAITHESAFTDKTNRFLRDPIDLIKTALKATGGDQLKMNKIFQDVVGGRTVTGLTRAFNTAGGGDAGLAEVDKMIARMMKAQMSKDEVRDSAALRANDFDSKAQRFQNDLDRIHEQTLDRLVPALEKATPSIINFAETLGRAATWTVENPKTAIAMAISASIARAGIESALRSGIERLLLGPGGKNAAGLGAAAGRLGAGLTIASLGVTTLTVGMAVIDHLFNKAQEEQTGAVLKGVDATNLQNQAGILAGKGDVQGAIAKEKDAIEAKKQEIAATEGQKPDFWGKLVDLTMTNADQREALKSRDAAIARAGQQQQRELAEMRAHLARLVEIAEAGGGAPGGKGGGGRVEQ